MQEFYKELFLALVYVNDISDDNFIRNTYFADDYSLSTVLDGIDET